MFSRILTLGFVTALVFPSASFAADGQVVFQQMCAACHVTGAGAKPTVAPNLRGVVGRKAGSTVYAYSAALKGSGLVWTEANLERFLSGPMAMVPGTRMPIQISDPVRRKAVISYLATLK